MGRMYESDEEEGTGASKLKKVADIKKSKAPQSKAIEKKAVVKKLIEKGTPAAKEVDKQQAVKQAQENSTKTAANMEPTKEKAIDQVIDDAGIDREEAELDNQELPDLDPKDKVQGMSKEFKESLMFFGPRVAGLLIGGLVGSRKGKASQGALIGLQSTSKVMDDFQKARMGNQKMELEERKVSAQEAAARQAAGPSWQQAKYTTSDGKQLTFEKNSGQYITADGKPYTGKLVAEGEGVQINKAIAAQLKEFGARKSVVSLKESMSRLNDIEVKLGEAKALAKGTIKIDILKGIAREVGNLSQQELKGGKVDLGFVENLKSNVEEFFKQGLSEARTKELRKVLDVLRKKRREELQEEIKGFAGSRSKLFGKQGDIITDSLSTEYKDFLPKKEKSEQEMIDKYL
tara:strand:+ start:1550 stop:2758 length:1209 start_codon:yes stop_codon:yes gene_type:complete